MPKALTLKIKLDKMFGIQSRVTLIPKGSTLSVEFVGLSRMLGGIIFHQG